MENNVHSTPEINEMLEKLGIRCIKINDEVIYQSDTDDYNGERSACNE